MKANVLQFRSQPLDEAHCETRRSASFVSVGVDDLNMDHHSAASTYENPAFRIMQLSLYRHLSGSMKCVPGVVFPSHAILYARGPANDPAFIRYVPTSVSACAAISTVVILSNVSLRS